MAFGHENLGSRDVVCGSLAQFFVKINAKKTLRVNQIVALNKLVNRLIGCNIWNKLVAIYPFVGGTADLHSYNIKDITKYKITWSGALVHSWSGVTGAGGYGTTGIPMGMFSPTNIHLSAYNATKYSQVNAGGRLIGHHSTFGFKYLKDTAAQELNLNNGTDKMTGYVFGEFGLLAGYGYTPTEILNLNLDVLGLMVGNNSSECYLEGNLFGNHGPLVYDRIYPACDKQIILLGNRYYGSVLSASTANLRFASVGYGLTTWEIKRFSEAVSEFQTTLLRNPCN